MQQASQRSVSQRQLDAFYNAGIQPGYSNGPAFAASGAPDPRQPGQAPQFGSFSGSFGQGQNSQFGGFGQTAFVPTGKQPDWSVPSNTSQTHTGGNQSNGNGPGFPLGSRSSPGLESIWQATPDAGGQYPPGGGPSRTQAVSNGGLANVQQVLSTIIIYQINLLDFARAASDILLSLL